MVEKKHRLIGLLLLALFCSALAVCGVVCMDGGCAGETARTINTQPCLVQTMGNVPEGTVAVTVAPLGQDLAVTLVLPDLPLLPASIFRPPIA